MGESPDGGVPADAGLGPPDVGPPHPGPVCGLALAINEGGYVLQSCDPAWTFAGTFAVPVSNLGLSSGRDALGEYLETGFDFTAGSAHHGTIRIYSNAPIALFSLEYVTGGPGGDAFPVLSTLPGGLHGLGYWGTFSQYSFTRPPDGDSPRIFFDDSANTFILSEASHFMHASITTTASGALAVGLDPAIPTIPAGYVQTALLVVEPGINKAFETWGHALLALSGKTPVSNSSSIVLSSLGYWTDNGQNYYYAFDPARGYEGTLDAVANDFQSSGIPMGYVQLDSWWYPKGAHAQWNDLADGMYTFGADPAIFPDGLDGFHAKLGLPLVTHARWVDPASPYHGQYQMSDATIIDPAYWTNRMHYLRTSGVVMYEQDWLDQRALPALSNLTDAEAFLGNMAAAAQAEGLSIMYCMPLPGHLLQSTLYPNVVTSRVSPDRFDSTKWSTYLYDSRLASALGIWPWSDAFFSTERDNLILSTLSAGPVGVGDAPQAASAANLLSAARPDSVLVRPDTSIVPIDSSFVNEAAGTGQPMIAAASTVDGNVLRAAYVFTYKTGTGTTATFAPKVLGFSGPVVIYDVFASTAVRQDASSAYSHDVSSGPAYLIIVPVGTSGIGFLGDLGKYVSLGRQRISSVSDDGAVHVGVAFAAAETAVTLRGHAPSIPNVAASLGSAEAPSFDPSTGLFQVAVHPANGAAEITIAP